MNKEEYNKYYYKAREIIYNPKYKTTKEELKKKAIEIEINNLSLEQLLKEVKDKKEKEYKANMVFAYRIGDMLDNQKEIRKIIDKEEIKK